MQFGTHTSNMHGYLQRTLQSTILKYLDIFPAVTVLGPRQCGKSTLVNYLGNDIPGFLYLDLQKLSDRRKIDDVELFFRQNSNRTVCLDEIQLVPEIFSSLRSILDHRRRNGQILILGSASRDLIRQSSETLAGRIGYLELTPFLLSETLRSGEPLQTTLMNTWLRGGFPDSYLAASDQFSMIWRKNFIRTYMERDIPQLGFNIPATHLERFWLMLAHCQGQLLNSSKLGQSLDLSHHTIRRYIDLLEQTFMVRVLKPIEINMKKRLVKSPKVYIRDTGILHGLLSIDSSNDLLGHPVYGSSWETFVIENVLSELPQWRGSFYRATSGAEIDLVLEKGNRRIAVEIKASSAPRARKGFWNAARDLGAEASWIIALVDDCYPIAEGCMVGSLPQCIDRIKSISG